MDFEIKIHFNTFKSSFLGLRFFQEIFFIYVTFPLIYHILNPYNPTKIHKQKCISIKPTSKDKKPIHIFQFQDSNIYI
jgi:hypothetical protein